MTNFWTKFFSKRDDTGRYAVVSKRTGVTYLVEPIDTDPHRSRWGDVNPATKELEGEYGLKHRGAVDPSESLLTEDNGVRNIVELAAGESPESYIEKTDLKYPDRS